MNRLLIIALGVICISVAIWGLLTHPLFAKPTVPPGYSLVTNVFDGDTIEAEANGERLKVRLMGIDTPETVDPRRPMQCFGKEASSQSKRLMEGKAVRLAADAVRGAADTRDKYGRLLRYVYLTDGTLVNERLLADGYALEYTYQRQKYDLQADFKAAEREARTAQRGLWASNTCRGDTKKAA